MHVALDLKLLLLLATANGIPVLAKTIFGHRLAHPLDGGTLLWDGQPLLGPAKTFRGVVLSIVLTGALASAVRLAWQIGVLIAVAAMAGDACSSFWKRRLKLPSSSRAIGIDQMPESLLPLLACAIVLPLSVSDVVAIGCCFFVGELLLSRVLYRFHLRDQPY